MFKEIKKDLDKLEEDLLERYGYDKESIEINSFLANSFRQLEIETILYSVLKEREKIREKKLAHGQKEGSDSNGIDNEVYDSQAAEGILTMLDYFISLGDQESEQDNEEQNTQTADEFNFDNAYAEYLSDEDDGYDEDEEEYFGLSM